MALDTSVPIADAWQTYLDSPGRPDSGAETLHGYKLIWDAFARWLRKHHPAAEYVAHVDPAIANQYAAALAIRDAATAGATLGIIKAAA